MSDQLQSFFDTHRNSSAQPIPGLTSAKDILREANVGWLTLKMPFIVPHEEMLAEAMALLPMFVHHRANGHHKGWASLCLHGLSSVHTENHDRYGFKDASSAPYKWTDISSFCPITTSFFRDVFGYRRYERLRFMLLEPGGFILPHRDTDHNRLSAINLALNNPDDCEFVMENDGIVPFSPGTANILALNRQHAVWNRSSYPRIHVIAHGERDMDGHWPNTIFESYRERLK